MKQKLLCLNLLGIVALLASFRALWSILGSVFGGYLGTEVVGSGTASYNVLFAAALWWAWAAVKRIPTP